MKIRAKDYHAAPSVQRILAQSRSAESKHCLVSNFLLGRSDFASQLSSHWYGLKWWLSNIPTKDVYIALHCIVYIALYTLHCLVSNFLLRRSDLASKLSLHFCGLKCQGSWYRHFSVSAVRAWCQITLLETFGNLQGSDSKKTHTRWLFDTPTWTMVISLDLIHIIVDLNLHG